LQFFLDLLLMRSLVFTTAESPRPKAPESPPEDKPFVHEPSHALTIMQKTALRSTNSPPLEETASLCLQEAREAELSYACGSQSPVADRRPLIALAAHDNMKTLMASFAPNYVNELGNVRLTGTGTTC